MNQKSESSLSTFVAQIDPSLSKQLLQDLKQQGFEFTYPPYTHFAAKKKGVNCILYHSGKLVVQGKERGEFIEFYLEPQILKTFTYTHKELCEEGAELDLSGRIGIDESGKGDFFGPLCIAGVYAEGEAIVRLKQFGVRDSKTLNAQAIAAIAAKIRNECVYHIVKINPLKYNELIVQFGNLNKLLAWGHATTIENLSQKTGCKKIIIDQFADERVVLTALKRKNLELDLTQRHKGEEDIVVAAASILARNAFVEGLGQMEKQFSMKLPKGASPQTIAAGKKFVRTFGRENLGQIGKLHFKTLDAILAKDNNDI
jgi:ribonuclease HIII